MFSTCIEKTVIGLKDLKITIDVTLKTRKTVFLNRKRQKTKNCFKGFFRKFLFSESQTFSLKNSSVSRKETKNSNRALYARKTFRFCWKLMMKSETKSEKKSHKTPSAFAEPLQALKIWLNAGAQV